TVKWGCNSTPTRSAQKQQGQKMRAERDQDDTVRTQKRPERRLAYEIAIGIIIGGMTLATIQALIAMIAWQIYLHDLKVILR
ncbi:hypothetical protein, partial [Pseudomonas amygdali]|uniref:hypothetical protein n=2 Tax=Pseudomonas amygdali TaxID=47877 RepID=UPI001F315623